ncbi:MAG: cation transporter [Bdellovibrionales bacterium]|nr:cation transporter [Bdellovibrionales bacterium]
MDCPSEERLIRMALEKSDEVKRLAFDLHERTVKVVHGDSVANLLFLLEPLGFGAMEIGTTEVTSKSHEDDEDLSANDKQERKALFILLVINGTMFLVELGLGLFAQSTGLIADSLDMLADALVYSISLFAVAKVASSKRLAAKTSGWLQMLLAFGALSEVIRRYLIGSEPLSSLMIGVSLLALIANVSCLWIISRHRHGGVHMKASWIFSSNDVVANVGVILAGFLVFWTKANWPDLVIGLIISAIVLRGAFRILRLSASRPLMKSSK